MNALIHLFIHIIKNPDSPSVPSDVALMEVGAGFFASVEFATESIISSPFAREIAVLSRTVSRRSKIPNEAGTRLVDRTSFSREGTVPPSDSATMVDTLSYPMEMTNKDMSLDVSNFSAKWAAILRLDFANLWFCRTLSFMIPTWITGVTCYLWSIE